jgi:hypothetical protein
VSWAAHQFEVYAVHAHTPKKMKTRVSFFGVWLGDFTPDFIAKWWAYGITINGHHYGAAVPQQWQRGFPGFGFSHTVFFGALLGLALWWWKRDRGLVVGFMLGMAAHVITDVNDSVGTMLLFPVTTLNWSLKTWSYGLTVQGGKYTDAASYYSSFGLAMDLFWLAVVLCSWRCLTREYWRTQVVAAEPHRWAWLGRYLPERGLLALYRATFFYGIARMVTWTVWAHLIAEPVINGVRHHGYPFDFSWTGPWWMHARSLPHVNIWLVAPTALALLAGVYAVLGWLWEPMGRAEADFRRRERKL